MKRFLITCLPFVLLIALASGAGAPSAIGGTTVNGVSLDTVTLNDDGSRTAVVLYAEKTYNVHLNESFPAGVPLFQAVAITDTTVMLQPTGGGVAFALSTIKPADE